MFPMAYRAPARLFQSVPFSEDKTAFNAFSRYNLQFPAALRNRFLNMFEVSIHLFLGNRDPA